MDVCRCEEGWRHWEYISPPKGTKWDGGDMCVLGAGCMARGAPGSSEDWAGTSTEGGHITDRLTLSSGGA